MTGTSRNALSKSSERELVLYTDGAARGNPGPAAIGVVLADVQGNILMALGQVIGKATNNEAEYRALLVGLDCAAKRGAESLSIRTDSELMTQQLLGTYRVRAPNLKSLFEEAKKHLGSFGRVDIRHIPREQNRKADALANQALDLGGTVRA